MLPVNRFSESTALSNCASDTPVHLTLLHMIDERIRTRRVNAAETMMWKSTGGFRSVRRNCTRYDNRDLKKSRLFRPEVTLIKMCVNVRLFARILFQKFKRSLIMYVIIIMQRRSDNSGIFLLAEYYMYIKNLVHFFNDISYLNKFFIILIYGNAIYFIY